MSSRAGSYRWLAAAAAVMLVSTAGAGCVSVQQPRGTGDCVLSAADSLHMRGVPLYPECAVERAALPARSRLEAVAYTPSRQGAECSMAEVRFVVGADGVPEAGTASIVRANDDGFARVVLASVPAWRYRPALLGGVPVRQVMQERRTAQATAQVAGNGGRTRTAAQAGSQPAPCSP